MQNQEAEEFSGKKVKFSLVDKSEREYTEQDITSRSGQSRGNYVIFWYDAKMKNYLNFLEFLALRKFIQAEVEAFLVVDKKDYMQNIEKIKQESTDQSLKSRMKTLMVNPKVRVEKKIEEEDEWVSASEFSKD